MMRNPLLLAVFVSLLAGCGHQTNQTDCKSVASLTVDMVADGRARALAMGEDSYTEEGINNSGYHSSFITNQVSSSSSHEKKFASRYALQKTHFSGDMANMLYTDTYKRCLRDVGELEVTLN